MTGPTCPECGTPDAQVIVYGLPTEPPPDGYVTGGCDISPDGGDPTHECRGPARHHFRAQ